MAKKATSKALSSTDKEARLQEVKSEIQAIGNRATLLLGYLTIVLVGLTSFVFSTGDLRAPALALFGAFLFVACIVFSVLALSFVISDDDMTLEELLEANSERLKFLKFLFRLSIIFAFLSLASVFAFAIYSF